MLLNGQITQLLAQLRKKASKGKSQLLSVVVTELTKRAA